MKQTQITLNEEEVFVLLQILRSEVAELESRQLNAVTRKGILSKLIEAKDGR